MKKPRTCEILQNPENNNWYVVETEQQRKQTIVLGVLAGPFITEKEAFDYWRTLFKQIGST